MATVYFLDNNDEPDPAGDVYADFDAIDAALSFGGACEKWSGLTPTQKEDALKALTIQIDMQYKIIGNKYDSTQPLDWPRINTGLDSKFDIEAQKKALFNYCQAQLEYLLVKMPIGILQISEGNQAVTSRQQIIAREAKASIYRFIL